MPGASFDSAYLRRSAIAASVEDGLVDSSVLSQLIIDGIGIKDEGVLWDFKRELPVPPKAKLNATTKSAYDCKFAEIVKDCVSFYNTHGGYLVIGIEDDTRKVVGFSGDFDAADLNKRIQGATGANIETIYRVISIGTGSSVPVGLLFIPKRQERMRPAQFKKSAPPTESSYLAYRQDDFYFRERDICRPAKTSEDLEFLFGPRLLDTPYRKKRVLENNLPSRDEELSRLVGRDSEITQLWAWLADNFSPVKVLSGLGGVGKTSIAYTFAERLINQAPPYIDKVLWLGAKSETFLPLKAQLTATRVDFQNIEELLLVTLWETGCPPNQVPEQPSRDQLMELAQQHLSAHNYLLIVDNVDTLDDDEQQELLHLLSQLCSVAKAKGILTARRNLSAPRAMVIKIEGLSFDDFQVLVEEKSRLLEMQSPVRLNSAEMRDFYQASGGSPLFAASILRLVWLGDSFREALQNWRGHDGETVREAAFQREIGRLGMDSARVLLALCYLDRASAVELTNVLSLTRLQVQTALESLQQFSMTTIDSILPGGAVYKLPSMLELVSTLVERRVEDWKKIKASCRQLRSVASNKYPVIGDAIRRTLAQLNAREPQNALKTVRAALQAVPDDPDLLCLLGRVYVKANDLVRAEETYQRAFDLGCKQRALVDGWLEVRETHEDWRGAIPVCEIGEKVFKLCRYLISKCRALMMIGDQYSRVGKYSEAEAEYEKAILLVKDGLDRYQYPADRANLWKLNESLVIRWLGAIRMTASSLEGRRRFFGACHKAIMTYRLISDDVLRSALEALNAWCRGQSARGDVSETTRANAKLAERRLLDLRQFVNSRPGFSDAAKEEIRTETDKIIPLLDVVILQKDHRSA